VVVVGWLVGWLVVVSLSVCGMFMKLADQGERRAQYGGSTR
jgi:hypothetical protein